MHTMARRSLIRGYRVQAGTQEHQGQKSNVGQGMSHARIQVFAKPFQSFCQTTPRHLTQKGHWGGGWNLVLDTCTRHLSLFWLCPALWLISSLTFVKGFTIDICTIDICTSFIPRFLIQRLIHCRHLSCHLGEHHHERVHHLLMNPLTLGGRHGEDKWRQKRWDHRGYFWDRCAPVTYEHKCPMILHIFPWNFIFQSPGFWRDSEKFEKILRRLWEILRNLRRLWENLRKFEKTLRNFEKTLRNFKKFWENLRNFEKFLTWPSNTTLVLQWFTLRNLRNFEKFWEILRKKKTNHRGKVVFVEEK